MPTSTPPRIRRGFTCRAGIYQLTLFGAGGDIQGDLDITNHIAIIGTGAGEAIIDATLLRSTNSDRIFDVAGGTSLSVYCVTLTGGRAPGGPNQDHGGAIIVRDGGTLVIGHSAVVGNEAVTPTANGGAIVLYTTRCGHRL